jgi:hypothetical protein
MITEASLTERERGKVTSLRPAGEGMKLRTQIYAKIFPIALRDWADESDWQDSSGENGGLQNALFHFFLAGEAITSPRHGFQALLLKFLMARDAFAETVVFDASQSVVH